MTSSNNCDICVACFDDLEERETTYNATMDGYLCTECTDNNTTRKDNHV